MKKLLILFLFTLSLGCSEDEFVNSYGTQFLRIDYQEDDRTWAEVYHYQADGQLAQVEDFRSLGWRYELEYQDTVLRRVFTYEIASNALGRRDSMTYTSDGQLDVIYIFSGSPGEVLSLDIRYDYDYGSLSKVVSRQTYYREDSVPRWLDRYYWEGEQIRRSEHYNEEDGLDYEVEYTYDQQKNYLKMVPPHLYDPVNWGANNVTIASLSDYTGLIDASCYRCVTTYRYNQDGYPVEILKDWGLRLRLTYE